MIDYETLCQHISDWREGKKPGLPPPLPGGVAAAQPVGQRISTALCYRPKQHIWQRGLKLNTFDAQGGCARPRSQTK